MFAFELRRKPHPEEAQLSRGIPSCRLLARYRSRIAGTSGAPVTKALSGKGERLWDDVQSNADDVTDRDAGSGSADDGGYS